MMETGEGSICLPQMPCLDIYNIALPHPLILTPLSLQTHTHMYTTHPCAGMWWWVGGVESPFNVSDRWRKKGAWLVSHPINHPWCSRPNQMGNHGYLWPLPLRMIDSLLQPVVAPIQHDGWLKQVGDKVMTRPPESCIHTPVSSSDIIKGWHLHQFEEERDIGWMLYRLLL